MKNKAFIVTVLVSVSLFLFGVSSYGAVERSSTSSSRGAQGSSSGSTGLGVMFGEPTGITLKHWLSGDSALQFGVTYSFNNYFALLGDYLWHFKFKPQFTPYVGLGAEIFFDSSNSFAQRFNRDNPSSVDFAMRIPLGIEFLPRKVPLGIFAEVVPAVGLIPGVFGFVQGDIGIRIYL